MNIANVEARHDESKHLKHWKITGSDIYVTVAKPSKVSDGGQWLVSVSGTDAERVLTTGRREMNDDTLSEERDDTRWFDADAVTEDQVMVYALGLLDAIQAVYQLHQLARSEFDDTEYGNSWSRQEQFISETYVTMHGTARTFNGDNTAADYIKRGSGTGIDLLGPEGVDMYVREYFEAQIHRFLSTHRLEREIATRYSIIDESPYSITKSELKDMTGYKAVRPLDE